MQNQFLLFEGFDANGTPGLWVTDGTAAGTHELTGISGANPAGLSPRYLTVFNGQVLFDGFNASGAFGLWVTDGTSAGTHELAGISAASPSGLFSNFVNPNFTPFNGQVLFSGVNASGVKGLWVTDGTVAGTHELTISGAPPAGVDPYAMAVLGTKVIFAGSDVNGARVLWVTDGTGAGTHELSGISGTYQGGLGLLPIDLVAFKDLVLFEGKDANGNLNLWVTDGTAAGTHELTGISGANPGGLFSNFGNPNPDFTVFNGRVLFNGLNGDGTFGLWVTDGTAAGTHELTGISGANSNGLMPRNMTIINDKVVFMGWSANGGFDLWTTDGTAAGTHQVTSGGLWPSLEGDANFASFNGQVFFNPTNDFGLWVTDGTSAGTHELTGIIGASSGGLNPLFLTAFSSGAVTTDQISPYIFDNTVFNQTSDTAPPVPWFYFFSIGATFLTAGDYSVASASYPGAGSPQTLALIAPTKFDFSSSAFTSFSTLQAAYPFGTYTVTGIGNQISSTSSVSYQANYFTSAVPFITNYSGLNGLNPSTDFTVHYNSFTPDAHVTTGFTFLTIWNASTHQVVFHDDFQSPSSTTALIPANTLSPNTNYTFELEFSDLLIVGSSTQGFDMRTDGSFTTGPISQANHTIVPGGRVTTNDFGATLSWGSINPDATIPSATLTHPAVDITAPLGTEVDAFASGTVVEADYSLALGWYVRIHHSGLQLPTVANGKDFYTLYAHLENQPLVSAGQTIGAGTKIGEVGTTGSETGVQAGFGLLHFEIRLFGNLFHPQSWTSWDLPKAGGLTSNIYIYGARTAAQLLADPDNTGLGYINPDQFLVEGHTSRVTEGYIGAAIVFADDNNNGKLDPGELFTTTDAQGNFNPIGGTGTLIAYEGTDTSTGLPFKGLLEAPAGSTAITPLTTLVSLLQSQGVSAAEVQVLAALGISSSVNLTTFDPIAALHANNPDAGKVYAAGVEVMNTVTMIASALTAPGPIAQNTLEVLGALATLIKGSIPINLTDANFLNELISNSANVLHQSLDPTFVSSVASLVAASNSVLEQNGSQLTGQSLIDEVSAIERLAQGATSDALQKLAGEPALLDAVVSAFTGSNLTNALAPQSTTTNHAPWLATDSVVSHGITELAGMSGSGNLDSIAGKLLFTDADLSDKHQVGAALDQTSIKWAYADGTAVSAAIPADVSNALANAVHASLVNDSTNGSIGEIAWTLSAADYYFDFLAGGETLSVTYDIAVTDNNGASSVQPVTVVVTGTNDLPAVDTASTTASASISELPSVTGSSAIDTATGVISFLDPDLNDRPTATIDVAHQTVTYQDTSGHTFSLTSVQFATFESAFQITAESGNAHSGKIDWSYLVADKQLDFLGVSEALTVNTPVVIDDHHGGVVTENVVVTINGSNDSPIAVPDSNGVAKGGTLAVSAVKGVLANDGDPDLHEHLTVAAVNGTAANVGQPIHGAYGTLTLNADGSYIYAACHTCDDDHDRHGNDDRNEFERADSHHNIVRQDVFTYTSSDGHGGTATSTLSVVVVFNPGAKYQAGSNTTLVGDNSSEVLDGSAGNDKLFGGNGPDVLISGNGDAHTGGNGPDTFLFRPNFGANTITDFDVHSDAIQFDKPVFSSVSDLLSHTTNTTAGAVINDGHGDTITLSGVTLAQLQAHQSDFHLV
ncbi:ELWxxDGT repeat protein/VCBS repeat-containing protein [Bradyrhizobium japonicum]